MLKIMLAQSTKAYTHAHYAWFTKTYGLYPSHDALQVPKLLRVVASVYTTANTYATTPNIVVCTQPQA